MRVAWQKEVSQTSGEKMMRDRLRILRVSRKDRRRAGSILVLLAWALLCFSGVLLLLSNSAKTSAAGAMQLVRLNIVSDAGFVRIEITADGSFDDANVEHYSRGRLSVIRIRGARSLLRQSYDIKEALAREVRTVMGEQGGEPYVDIMVMLGEGATIAQKKNFNRLVIGVAADFAKLRRRAPAVDLARSRPAEAVTQPAVNKISLPAAKSVLAQAALMPAAANIFPVVRTSAEQLDEISIGKAPLIAASTPQTIFRGRTIWDNLPVASFQFSRAQVAGFYPMFFAQQNGVANATESVFASFTRMALDPPGSRLGVWVPGTTAAERDEVGGRVMGKGYLRPSFQLGAAYDDNYFYRSTVGRNLGIFTFAPRLEYEIPGVERAIRLSYEARLRRLSNGEWANGHVFDLDGRIDVTPFFRVALREHFVRSALDSQEFDPAGEVYIVGDTFNRNDAGVRAEYRLNDRSSLALDGAYNIVRWSKDHIAGAPLFIDYDELTGGISYDREISEETTATVGFTFGNSLSKAPLRPQFDGLSNFRRYLIEVGVRTQVSETSGAAFRIGYEHNDFRNAPDANDFNGLVFDLRFRQNLTESTFFELAALRKTQVSAFNPEGGNARLISTGGAARLETALTENLKLGFGLNYQRLDFPVSIVPTSTASGGVFVGQFAGEFREDHLYGFSLDAAYRFSDLFKTRLVYSFSRRDSTIPVFTFNRNRLSLVFEIGRRNEVRGRPF